MAEKYKKIDPIVLMDPRFVELLNNRWENSVRTNFDSWPFKIGMDREYQARRFKRSFNKKKKRKEVINQLIEARGKKCIGCGAKRNLTIDHVLPVTWGGTSDLFNLQLLCVKCNSSFGNLCPTIEDASMEAMHGV